MKKKLPDTPNKPPSHPDVFIPHLTSVGYHDLIDHELHRLSSPVVHVDPSTIDPHQLAKAIAHASH